MSQETFSWQPKKKRSCLCHRSGRTFRWLDFDFQLRALSIFLSFFDPRRLVQEYIPVFSSHPSPRGRRHVWRVAEEAVNFFWVPSFPRLANPFHHCPNRAYGNLFRPTSGRSCIKPLHHFDRLFTAATADCREGGAYLIFSRFTYSQKPSIVLHDHDLIHGPFSTCSDYVSLAMARFHQVSPGLTMSHKDSLNLTRFHYLFLCLNQLDPV